MGCNLCCLCCCCVVLLAILCYIRLGYDAYWLYAKWKYIITFPLSSSACKRGTHWGWYIYASVKYAIIGSDNGLLPDMYGTIIWTNSGTLVISPFGTNFSEIWIKIQQFSYKKMSMNMSSAKWPFCLKHYMLTHWGLVTPYGDRDLGQHWLM